MATLLAPPEPSRESAAQAAGPQQGVIDDARRRQRRRRARVTIALAVLAVAGAVIAVGSDRGGSHRSGAALGGPRVAASVRVRALHPGDVRLVPALRDGWVGWCVAVDRGEGCASLPTPRTPIFGGSFSYSPQAGWNAVAVTTPSVAAVAVDHATVRTRDIGLPYGLRVAGIRTAAAPGRAAVAPNGARRPPPAPPMTPALVPLDPRGHRMSQRVPHGGLPTVYWQHPGQAPPGPCRITAIPLPGLSAQWGHVAKRVRAYDDVVGRAFESCADTEFYLHNWPLETAILLDAAHPGKQPAPMPNMTRVAGAPDTFSAPGAFPSENMTATRLPNAWLVVAGGSGPAQRLTVLRHLHAALSLN